jgi:hypothetical protein
MRVAVPARSGIAWDSRMGLFHCMAEDGGIEDVKKCPVQQWAAGENSDDNNQQRREYTRCRNGIP